MVSPVSSETVARPRHLRRIARSFGYALEGLNTMLRTQPNFWVHLSAAAVVVVAGLILHLSALEMAVIVLTVALVLGVECVNTSLETMCDLVSPAYHPLVKRAKDISAAAVLISALASIVIAVLLFGSRLV